MNYNQKKIKQDYKYTKYFLLDKNISVDTFHKHLRGERKMQLDFAIEHDLAEYLVLEKKEKEFFDKILDNCIVL